MGNGIVSDTLVQGDEFALELDVVTPGNIVDIELFLDLDTSHTITEADRLLAILHMQDGDLESDSSMMDLVYPPHVLITWDYT